MKGTEFLATLPARSGRDRGDAILEAVRAGLDLDANFTPLDVEWNDHKGTIFVGSDVLRIGEDGDYVRVNVTALMAQLIADLKGWILPTTRICDLIWMSAAPRVEPSLQPYDRESREEQGYSPSMSDTQAMERHSDDVEVRRTGRCGLLENAGKQWVLTNKLIKRPDRGANYGFFSSNAPYRSASGLKMWQTLGLAHDAKFHADYSQTLRPVRAKMILDGRERLVAEVAADPELWGLVSSEGPIKLSRLPAAPPLGEEEPPAIWTPKPSPTRRLAFERILRRGMVGDDVAEWQSFVGALPDRKFGPITEGITRAWQAAHGLLPDGVVGPKTVAKANEVQDIREAAGEDVEDDLIDDFVQAKNYTLMPHGREIKWIVIHSAEMKEKPTAAEALAAWAAGPNAPRASWHFGIDVDSIVQCVRETDVAWHAPGANRHGIGIEHAGYARQTAEEWADEYSRDMLLRSARLVAWLCEKHRLPVAFVDREGLKAGRRGITTHNEVTMAFRRSTHTDPGHAFPMDWYLEQVGGA